MTRATCVALMALGATASLIATSCTDDGDDAGGGDGPITVESTDDACDVSTDGAASGDLRFAVTNEGTQVTDFYLLAGDGTRVVGRIENLAPGLTRPLVVTAGAGNYVTACKPGMVGDGIRAAFTVRDSGDDLASAPDIAELVATGTAQYGTYVRDEAEDLLAGTQAFAASYKAGDDDTARDLYAGTRVHWERIESIGESFGDFEPEFDMREAHLEAGQELTGWHRIEQDLWPPADDPTHIAATDEERAILADELVAETQELYDRTRDLEFTADQIGNGAKTLLDEAATAKVTGQEEIWSHTDLWAFQANIDGARAAFDGLRPALDVMDAELATLIDQRFIVMDGILDSHVRGDGWVLYTELTGQQVKELSDAVNALAEPLSQMTAAVVL